MTATTCPTPEVVARYLVAADAGDVAALADCFAADGSAVDEGRTYRGHAEITAWRTTLAGAWTYTATIGATTPVGPDEFRVQVRLEGNFPGGIADLTYRFILRDGLIEQLIIAA